MRKLILASFLSLAATNAFADAPTVNDAVLSDTGIVINGSGFGSENPMLFWDDVKTEYEETGASHGDEVQVSDTAKWGQNGNTWGGPFTYSQSVPSRAGKKDVVYYGEDHKNFLGSPNHEVVPSLTHEIYVSWWYKPSMSPSAEGGSNKFIRIWDDSNGNGTRLSWTHMHFTCGETVDWGNWNGNVGEWNHHAIYVDLASNTVKTWVNGEQIHDISCPKHPSYTDTPLYVYVLGFDHGKSDYQDMTTAMSDIYIGKSLARVEVSNSPKWSPTMTKEVLPIDSWDGTQITTKLNEGVIKLSGDIYVYVVNSDGEVNANGIKVDCPGCPKLQ